MMRKVMGFALTFIILVPVLAGVLYAQATVVVKEEIIITVDRAQVRTDVPPINVQGRTLVPVRGVFNAFDAEIQWFHIEKRAYIRRDNQVIWLRIGENRAQVNDDIVPLAVPAMIYRGRTTAPLRFIAEALGATVNWDPQTQTITIITRARAVVQPERPAPSPAPQTTPYQTAPY